MVQSGFGARRSTDWVIWENSFVRTQIEAQRATLHGAMVAIATERQARLPRFTTLLIAASVAAVALGAGAALGAPTGTHATQLRVSEVVALKRVFHTTSGGAPTRASRDPPAGVDNTTGVVSNASAVTQRIPLKLMRLVAPDGGVAR